MSKERTRKREDRQIVIVGAGVAGLVAARHLEEAGYHPLLIDRADRVGGRLRTDVVDGYQLDRGFQVLLTAYQEVQHYLNLPALRLQSFRPGALMFAGDERYELADPLREPSRTLSALTSGAASLRDKWLVFKLKRELSSLRPQDIFQLTPAVSTMTYLQQYGFSERIIRLFFQPFFAGIFLEQALVTPAAMFRFVFKMFSEGEATLPAAGIEAVARQLAAPLVNTRLLLDTEVVRVEDSRIWLENGSSRGYEALLLACPPDDLLQNATQPVDWHSTTCLYFAADHAPLANRMIGLVTDQDSVINNFCTLTEVAPTYAKEGALLSVSLKAGTPGSPEEWVPRVISELHRYLPGVPPLKFLQHYTVGHALPALDAVYYDQFAQQTRLTDHIFVAGDHQLNGSLDAAMRSGRQAALGIMDTLY